MRPSSTEQALAVTLPPPRSLAVEPMVSAGCLAVAIRLLDALAKGAEQGAADNAAEGVVLAEVVFDTEEAAAYISPISPLFLPYISHISPLYLPTEEAALPNPITLALAPALTLALALWP